jgi:hypothetical protein
MDLGSVHLVHKLRYPKCLKIGTTFLELQDCQNQVAPHKQELVFVCYTSENYQESLREVSHAWNTYLDLSCPSSKRTPSNVY